MFELGWSEILLIGVLAVVLLRPKDLPEAMRGFGKFVASLKRIAFDLQKQFNDVVREAELDDVRKVMDDVRDLKSLSPIEQVKNAITSAPNKNTTSAENEQKSA